MTKTCPTGLGRGYAPGRIPLTFKASHGGWRFTAATEIGPEALVAAGALVVRALSRLFASDGDGRSLELLGAESPRPTARRPIAQKPRRSLELLHATWVQPGNDLDLLDAEEFSGAVAVQPRRSGSALELLRAKRIAPDGR